MKYSEIIKTIRDENNLSQEKLGKILGVNQTTIGQWERGIKKPGYDSILEIYTQFGITPNEVLGIEDLKTFKTGKDCFIKNIFNNETVNINIKGEQK